MSETARKKTPSASSAKKPRAPRKPARDPYDFPEDDFKRPAPKKNAPARKKADRDPYDFPEDRRKNADAQSPKTPSKAAAKKSGASSHKAAGKKGGGKKGGSRGGYLSFLLAGLIVLCVLVGAYQLTRYAKFMKMRAAVDAEGFYAGTAVEGVDISQMTLSQAQAHWAEQIEPAYAGRTVTFDVGGSVTAGELGYESDYAQVLEKAWYGQKNGSLAQRYAALTAAGDQGYVVTRKLYDPAAVEAYVQSAAEKIDTPVQEAGVSGFDTNSLAFTFTQGTPGRTLDQEKLASDIESALEAGGGEVALSIAETAPQVATEDIQAQYGLRAYAVTDASSSKKNRLSNIQLALSSINGLCLQPGEEFSFNEVVGKRTAERGYKVATAYSAGEVTEELGGGICQVSTTLFNAVVKSDLEITERHNHSIPVSYVDKGKDATVSWGAQDFKFKNNTDAPVYIVALLSEDKKVRIGVFGKVLEDGMYITVESEVTHRDKHQTTYQYNAFLSPGTQSELQSGRDGYSAVAYKLYWTKDGDLIKKETLCKSEYRRRDAIIEYNN